MVRLYFTFLGAIFCFLVISAPALNASEALYPAQAQVRATAFLEHIDAQKWDQAYQGASAYFRLLIAKDEWTREQTRDHKLLGPPQKRRLTAVNVRDHYPDLPDGTYLLVLYQVATPVKAQARETLVLKQEQADWQVVKYNLQ